MSFSSKDFFIDKLLYGHLRIVNSIIFMEKNSAEMEADFYETKIAGTVLLKLNKMYLHTTNVFAS